MRYNSLSLLQLVTHISISFPSNVSEMIRFGRGITDGMRTLHPMFGIGDDVMREQSLSLLFDVICDSVI